MGGEEADEGHEWVEDEAEAVWVWDGARRAAVEGTLIGDLFDVGLRPRRAGNAWNGVSDACSAASYETDSCRRWIHAWWVSLRWSACTS